MKNFLKFTSSNKQNNLKLFFQLSIIVLVGILGLFLLQPSVQMQDINRDDNFEQNKKNAKEQNRTINDSLIDNLSGDSPLITTMLSGTLTLSDPTFNRPLSFRVCLNFRKSIVSTSSESSPVG